MRALVVLTALAAGAALAVEARPASPRPTLAIALEHPLTVAGRSFEARELVTVQAVGTFGTRTLRVRTRPNGTFRISFRAVSGSPCVLRRVLAVGKLGSRAALRLPPGVCAAE